MSRASILAPVVSAACAGGVPATVPGDASGTRFDVPIARRTDHKARSYGDLPPGTHRALPLPVVVTDTYPASSAPRLELRLSILDQCQRRTSGSDGHALRESLALASQADDLGYSRYWVAEHHATRAFECAAPEALCGQILARTRRLRVGTGGVLLTHYSPLKTAEVFRLLESLYPGRVDVGIGRALGGSHRSAAALAEPHGLSPHADALFPSKLRDLCGMLGDALPVGHPHRGIRVVPQVGSPPPVWLLGASPDAGRLAARNAAAFAYGHFIRASGGERAVAAYRDALAAARPARHPEALVAVFALCGESQADADRMAAAWKLWMVRGRRGDHRPLPTEDEAMAYEFSEEDRALLAPSLASAVIGDAASCRAQLRSLAHRYGVGEIMVLTACARAADRRLSYERLARAFALSVDQLSEQRRAQECQS